MPATRARLQVSIGWPTVHVRRTCGALHVARVLEELLAKPNEVGFDAAAPLASTAGAKSVRLVAMDRRLGSSYVQMVIRIQRWVETSSRPPRVSVGRED